MNWNENRSKISANRGEGKKRVDVQPRILSKSVSPDLESCVPHCAFSPSFHLYRPMIQCFECISTSPFQLLPYMWLGKWYRMVNWCLFLSKCRCREWGDGLKPRPHWLHPPPFHLSNLTHNNTVRYAKKKWGLNDPGQILIATHSLTRTVRWRTCIGRTLGRNPPCITFCDCLTP